MIWVGWGGVGWGRGWWWWGSEVGGGEQKPGNIIRPN